MISKRVLFIAVAILVGVSTTLPAAVTITDHFNVSNLYLGGQLQLGTWGVVTTQTALPDPADPTGQTPLAGTIVNPPFQGVRAFVANGYHGGAWDGTVQSIVNTTAASSSNKYALAILTGAEWKAKGTSYASFHSIVPTDSSALLQFTYMGDATVDGLLSSSDLTLVKQRILVQTGGGTLPAIDWVNGDLNYDGILNSSDLTLVKQKLLIQTASGSTYPQLDVGTIPAAAAAAVPEPSTIVLVLIAVACLLGIRKFR